jgi:predicted ester cyclase
VERETNMTPDDLREFYLDYIACLNARDLGRLDAFVSEAVEYNGERIGLAGYRQMLEQDIAAIPDLHYDVTVLVSEPPCIAARLRFACTPGGEFMGLPVNGRRVSFSENVFYKFEDRRIAQVWSVIDKAALERQL